MEPPEKTGNEPPAGSFVSGWDGPAFEAPWQGQAFAMVVLLHQRGVFTWSEWAETLGRHIAGADSGGVAGADASAGYFRHWLAALEQLVVSKGIAGPATLVHYRDAWDRAARRTPHGQPISLAPDDVIA